VFGTGLGPATPQAATAFPLPTSGGLGGTAVQVNVGTTSLYAVTMFTSASQLLGILPSRTPVGAGTMTVTYNGQTSPPQPIQVVPNSFGVFAVNEGGFGPAVVTDPQYQLITNGHSANPGDILTIWRTGLGAVPGDESLAPPTPVNLTNLLVSVMIGGTPANVLYQGRSGCCAGLDQIAFQVPAGIVGCSVPLAVSVNGVVSNFTSSSIAQTGAECAVPVPAGAPSLPDSVTSTLQSGGSVAVAEAGFARVQLGIFGAVADDVGEGGLAYFYKYSGSPTALLSNLAQTSAADGYAPAPQFQPGSCFAGTTLGPHSGGPGESFLGLDAGASVVFSAGSEVITDPQTATGVYGANVWLQPSPAVLGYLSFGSLALNGSGGTDVGAFTANAVLAPPLMNLNLPAPGTTIARNQDLTIAWTGGGTDYVTISGDVFVSTCPTPCTTIPLPGYYAGFSCLANAGDGSFTVPAWVLSTLPASAIGHDLDGLFVAQGSFGTYFTAPGLDLGILNYFDTIGSYSFSYQ